MSIASSLLRWAFKRGDDKRDAGLTTPEDIRRFDDLRYGEDPKWNVLDVYRPKGAEGKLPVIVSVHGGGWVYGDKERYQYYCMSLAQQGFAVVNFTYRLAPKYKFPAQLEDTNAVFCWLMDNAETYGLDTTRVFGVGDSAGAHISGASADTIEKTKRPGEIVENTRSPGLFCVWGGGNLEFGVRNCAGGRENAGPHPPSALRREASPLGRGTADAIHALRYPENTSGLRNSSCFPTAAATGRRP